AAVARKLLGEPNKALSSGHEWRYGTHGSIAVDVENGRWFDHENQIGGGVLGLIGHKTGRSNRERIEWLRAELGIDTTPAGSAIHHQPQRLVAQYDYRDEQGNFLYQVRRFGPKKKFYQRRPDGNGGWINQLDDVRR